ncbi:MAG: hypothetical protein V3T80_01145 [Kiloniellales bacterium]
MTAPRLATTRPAALTGTIGQGGLNRPHDVALVQALLGAKRDRRSRPYLRDYVTGKYDQATAEALMGYRMDMRDQNIRRPLARSGPLLNKLAQGQALAVPEGTAIPYKIATLAEPGPIEGPTAGLLSAERKVALKEMMKEFIRDWGIAFDVDVKAATGSARSIPPTVFESRPLVAHFTPRNLWVRLPRGLSAVPSNAQFRARAKALYEIVEADLKARCAEAFAIKDPVDVKIQQGLKDDLACVVRSDLEGVEALAQFLLAAGRKLGLKLAVRFFEHYLGASGSSIEVTREEAFEFDLIRNAVQENIERFKQRNFIAPETSTPGSSVVEDITKNPRTRVAQFQDHWKVDINLTSVSGIERFAKARSTDETDTISILFGAGASSLTSTGDFLLQRQGDRILVEGKIMHEWSDVDGYNFNAGAIFHPESQVLERHKKAKPFKWKAEWRDSVEGVIQIENAFQPDAKRRWISFVTVPGS